MLRIGLVVGLAIGITPARAAELDAAKRGEKALLERTFIPAFWSKNAYDHAWRQWSGDAKEAPADYDRRFRDRYGLRHDLGEDVPAWWLLKKKQTMYHTGGTPARSVRSLMQFMLHPLNGPDVFQREEKAFEDIQAYLLSLEPPKYPFAIDAALAKT